MKKITFRSPLEFVFLLIFSLTSLMVFAQTENERKQITNTYDKAKIETLKQKFSDKAIRQKEAAIAAAKVNGWPVYRKNANGTYDELMRLSPDGKPIYFSLDNVNAAKTTRANTLNSGGILGLSLDGQNMFSGVWDGGPVRTTHQEFGGRVLVTDGNTVLTTNSAHSTHVTGTVCAAGVSANAKGMAKLSTVKSFDWNNDQPEVLEQAQNGLLLSNHSYGVPIANVEGNWYMGAYSQEAADWDALARVVPYYLMVTSAGNDGGTTNPSPTTAGYDKLTGNKNAKNNLVIANCQDATVDTQGNITSVAINNSSSQGPSDDRRIKPDITGNGTGLYSSIDTNDTAYGTYTGTSMASPNVMGTLLLVQQHYRNINNTFMKSATLKGLACNTADDKGRVGPDAVWGWGVLNAKKAAQAITGNGLQSWISEETLSQGQTYTFNAQSDGVNPMVATICWTDVPGVPVNGTLNDITPALVNDLDIRVTKNATTYYPWKLLSSATANATRTGDNNVDNVETVKIDAPSGAYTITVTHKATLQDGPQNFSLIVTGLTSVFSLASFTAMQTACLDGNAAYAFHLTTTNTTPVNFSVTGLPTGATGTFTSPSLSSSGDFSLNIGNLTNAASGIYQLNITANNGTETETRNVSLKISSANIANVVLASPTNNQSGISTNLQLVWDALNNADSFHLQVATDAGFTNIIAETTTTATSYSIPALTADTNYYWRVFPINNCGESTSADISSFQTGHLTCGFGFEPANYDGGVISPLGSGGIVIPISVTGGFTIGDLNVVLKIDHTYIQDLTVFLEGPESIGFQRVVLFKEPCGDNDNIDCTLDDSGSLYICNATIPAISGTVKPFESLNAYNNKSADGTWYLYVNDGYTGDGGAVTFAKLDFCSVSPMLAVANNNVTNFTVYPNPTKGIFNVQLANKSEGKTTMTLFDVQGRSIMSKDTSSLSETLDISHLQDGVYMLTIENGNQKTTKKIVLNK